MADLTQRFLEIVPGGVLKDEPMKNHTTFRIGGPADYFLMPQTPAQIKALIEECQTEGLPFFMMGNGSNLLVSDDGYRGAVIRIAKNMSGMKADGDSIEAEAGALLSSVASFALENSLTGFEFAGGIPGTLGGAVFMNAGAYGGEMKDVIGSVTVLDLQGNESVLLPETLSFGYRTSSVRQNKKIVLSARIMLSKGNPKAIREKSEDLAARRRNRQPLEMPSAGSTFKRPEGYFAGKLIMDAGLCGFSIGGARVSEKHCGFIVNTGDATARDVKKLIRYIQKTVFEKENVHLEPEVMFLGEESPE